MIDALMADLVAEGVGVLWRDLGRRRGEYRDDHRLIVISTRLSGPQAISTLAHEAGHAHYRDRETTPAVEGRADRWGARRLISPEVMAEAEAAAGAHAGAIARELGVTRAVVEAWRESWRRGERFAA